MAEEDNTKIVTSKNLEEFFCAADIDVSAVLKSRNQKQKFQAERNPGIGSCIGDESSSCSSSFGSSNLLNSSIAEESRGPNILYLTTECNLACEYCYERSEREELKQQKTMSKKEVSEALSLIYKKWKRHSSNPETVVIFGGEPFLVPDLIKYILDESDKLDKKAFAFCLTTNGLWFLKESNVQKYKEWTKDKTISLEISWDGSGNYRRIYKNKKPAGKDIEKAIDNLNKYSVPITLRYTIHTGNYDKVIQDYVYSLEKWSNIKKIQNSYDCTALDTLNPNLNWEQLIYDKFNYREYYKAIWNKYEVPLCQEVCDLCDYCDLTLTAVNYFIPEEEEVLVKTSNEQGQIQNKPFDHWLNKDIEE